MKSLGSQIKAARQQRHLSQSALARQVGCKQSALSMFESGRNTALNAQVIGKLCAALGLLAPSPAELQAPPEHEAMERTFCPNASCPGNLPVKIGERVVLVPHKHFASAEERHCAWCGEVLERACPECGAPVNEGAFCTHCGTAYFADAPKQADNRRVEASEQLMAWAGANG